MRPAERLPAPHLGRPHALERGQERLRLRRLADAGAIPDLHLLMVTRDGAAVTGQRWIHTRDLGLQRRGRAAATADQLHADDGELLVPRGQASDQDALRQPLLQESIAPRQDLPEPDEGRPMRGIEPGGEAIEKISPHRGHAVDDLEILPAERDRARPFRRRLARVLPGPVLEPVQRPPDRPLRFAANEVAGEGCGFGSPARNLSEPGGPEGPSRDDESERFEEVGFALRVRPADDVQAGRRAPRKGAVIPDFRQLNAPYPQTYKLLFYKEKVTSKSAWAL